MEIGPVSGVRIAPIIRPMESDIGVVDVYQVERTTRTRDETYSPGGDHAGTGFEDENDVYDDLLEESAAERALQPPANGKVNYFA